MNVLAFMQAGKVLSFIPPLLPHIRTSDPSTSWRPSKYETKIYMYTEENTYYASFKTEETQSDYNLGLFWRRKKPFSAVESVMDMILNIDHTTHKSANKSSKIKKVSTFSSDHELNNDTNVYFQHFFAPLYTSESSSSIPILTNSSSQSPQSNPNTQQNSFLLSVAYRGNSFCGWQQQSEETPENPSVQKTLINILDPECNIHHDTLKTSKDLMESNTHLKRKKIPKYKPLDIRVCGRTDAGVHAAQQICRIRTRKPVSELEIQNYINQHPLSFVSQKLRLKCNYVSEVTSFFHPTFCATCRAYAYFIDISNNPTTFSNSPQNGIPRLKERHVPLLNSLFRSLERKSLDYYAYSYGKVKTETTICTLYHSRVSMFSHNDQNLVICIELVGDRFLRRMVRTLVSTAIREVLEQDRFNQTYLKWGHINNTGNELKLDRLVTLANTKQRNGTAKAAPPDGLIFMGAGFDKDYAVETCLET